MKTNQQLKDAHLPFCDWRTFLRFTGPEGTAPQQKDIDALDHHFRHFVPPGPCIKCGQPQGAENILDSVLGKARFKWGIRHGEGQCSTPGCGWPARALHYDIGPIQKLELILQYHPDVVTWDE